MTSRSIMPLTLQSLLLWLFCSLSAAQTPVPLPETSIDIPEAPRYDLNRDLSPAQLLPGQTADVILTVTHAGSPDRFTLTEQLPAGLLVIDAPNASQEGRFLRWQGSGQSDTQAFRYTVQVECSAPPLLAWQGTLTSPVLGQVPAPVGLLERRDLTITPVSNNVRVDDEGFLELRLSNPSSNPVAVTLQANTNDNRVTLDSPNANVDLAAGGETTVLFPIAGNRLGTTDVELQPQVDGRAGCPVNVPVLVEAPPSLPPAHITTTLELQLDTTGIRNLTGLAVIVPLVDGVEVSAGTAVRVDESGQAHPLADPLVDVQRLEIPNTATAQTSDTDTSETSETTETEDVTDTNPHTANTANTDVTVYPKAAVFTIEEDLGTVQTLRFNVSHEDAFQFDPTLASLVGLTPEPFVISGRQDASERYLRAVPDTRSRPVTVAREGTLILSPAENTLIRSGNTSTIRVDVPLGGETKLFLGEGDNRQEVDPERIGQQITDRNVNRQTLDYIAVPLELGNNILTVEHTAADGTLTTDTLTVIVSGSATSLELRPLSTLVADSAEPLRFALDVRDAFGNIPTDGAVTLEIIGADPRTPDAEPQQLGYQLRYQEGRALLELVPVSEPRTLTFRASFEPGVSGSVENPILETNIVIDSNVRRWLVNGIGSVGVAVDDDFSVDAGASLFARGKLFEDYLLTFGVNYPFEPLGRFGDPYEPFPVPGASGELSQDAESRDGVFVRLERNLSFVQYGEFDTNLNTTLVNLDRSYTGVSATYRRFAGGLFARGFAAYIPVGQTVNDVEIAGDGTTFYVLPGAPIEVGSLSVQVIKRSAFDPNLNEDEADRLIQDGDPLVGNLVELRDYTIDETLGFLRLSRPLPPIDSEGNRYFLQVSYRRAASSNTRDWQAGGEVGYEYRLSETETATVFVSGYRETTETREVTVVGARGELDTDGLEADIEIAVGSETRQVSNVNSEDGEETVETDSSGLGLATGVRYDTDTVDAEVRYQYLADDFRSSEVTRASQTGHSLDGQLEILLARYLGVGFEAMWKDSPGSEETGERNREYAADVYGLFIEDGDFGIANRLEAEAGVGIRNDVPRLRFGVTFSDLVGVDGIRAELLHLQSLGDEPSVSELSLSYEIIENLSLEVTDRLEWGVDNALLIGLVSRFDNGDLFGSAANFGSSQLRAQYELPRGISNTGGTVRLGASTSYAATDTVSLEGSFDQIIDLDDTDDTEDADNANDLTSTTGDATIIAAALRYDDRDLDAQLRYEVRFDEISTKHVGNAGMNVALSNRLFASLTADVIADDSRDPDFGLRVSAAAAYRGEVVNLLTNNHLDTGAFEVGGGTVLEGDWRVDVPLDELLDLDPNLTVRAGYAYRYREAGSLNDDANHGVNSDNDTGYRDMISVGVSVEPWRGGSLTGYGRRFHDYDRDITAWGFTLEASQRVACGSYGVLAYSFDDIPDPVFSQEGLQVRLDVVADEQWRCGGGDIHGLAFIDANGDGIRQVATEANPDDTEESFAGIILRLYDADGRLITSTETDEDGRYHFENVDVNRDHIVVAVLPRGYRFSPLEQGDDPKFDSNISPDTGETPPFRVGRLRDTQHLDVGFIPAETQLREAQP